MSDVVRLAHGVVTGRDQRAWDLEGNQVDTELATGAPVAVGPAGAPPQRAVTELHRLIARGGVLAAGAGVDLIDGFHSARLEGARGDRRDAVLAALRAVEDADRLGGRAGILVALFGPSATKPVGLAAGQAIAEQRWGALQLASAASDLLGPEQLEQVLHLDADATQGTASSLADHLGQALGPFTRRRRLDLLLDLTEQVRAQQAAVERRKRLLDSQGRKSRAEELATRYARHEDDLLLAHVRTAVALGPEQSAPGSWYWTWCLDRALHNALSATALMRAAIAVADHGVREGLARSHAELTAVAALLDDGQATWAARKVEGLSGLPARPGCYVRDLLKAAGKHDSYAMGRLARARDYGTVVMEAVTHFLFTVPDWLSAWEGAGLKEWRAVAGHGRAPGEWLQPPLLGETNALAARPGAEETAADLLWYADLADALARLHGHAAAEIEYRPQVPYADVEPSPPEPAPLVPRLDSIPLAVAGVAQLVSLGGQAPPRCRTWSELVDGLVGSTEIAAAMTGAFQVPAPLAAWEGRAVPGTKARVEWAHTPRTLAEWSSYMGNCIASPGYVEDATEGRCGLAALRDRDGRILVNLELRPGRGGWRINELRARFNGDPAPELEQQILRWVRRLAAPAVPEPLPHPARPHTGRRAGRRPRNRLFGEVGEPLAKLVETAMASPAAVESVRVLEALHGGPGAATALRRLGPDRLTRVCRDALPSVGLTALWSATAARPLEQAVTELGRTEQLGLLLVDAPLLGSLRRIAKHPTIAPARTIELVARRIRAALGRLVREADPVLADAVAHAGTDVLCALVVTLTSSYGPQQTVAVTGPGETAVPGFPVSSLEDPDGPWQRAFPGAEELGADLTAFWQQVSAGGLVVPSAWLGRGGWPALWSRAARN